MGDDTFKGSVKIEDPDDKKTKVEVKYKAETDDKGQMTVTIKVEGERAVHIHTIEEAMEEEERQKKSARHKVQQDVQKAIQKQAKEILVNRQKSTDRVFKSMEAYLRG